MRERSGCLCQWVLVSQLRMWFVKAVGDEPGAIMEPCGTAQHWAPGTQRRPVGPAGPARPPWSAPGLLGLSLRPAPGLLGLLLGLLGLHAHRTSYHAHTEHISAVNSTHTMRTPCQKKQTNKKSYKQGCDSLIGHNKKRPLQKAVSTGFDSSVCLLLPQSPLWWQCAPCSRSGSGLMATLLTTKPC